MNREKPAPRQTLTLHGRAYETTFTRKFSARKPYLPKDPDRLTSIIPGLILELFASPGEKVRMGQSLLILEAMKMQNHITAPREGIIKRFHVAPGETVTKGQLLVELETMALEEQP